MKNGPRHFSEFPEYTDPGAINQRCRDMLKPFEGEAAELQIGVCQLEGDGRVAEDTHLTWTQYFLVIEGTGTLHLDGKEYPLVKDMIVEIPKGTRHYTTCETGQTLRYFFINVHNRK